VLSRLPTAPDLMRGSRHATPTRSSGTARWQRLDGCVLVGGMRLRGLRGSGANSGSYRANGEVEGLQYELPADYGQQAKVQED
jgi:hypothetical protein